MSADQTDYDVFISYARKDNVPSPDAFPLGWITAIRNHIATDHRQFSTAPLRLFFDELEIKDADDWRFRILGALKRSKMLLICLSPNYFASEYCRWEWEEYLRRQVHKLMGSESIATVYFIEVPGSDEQGNAKHLDLIMRSNFTDLRPWFPEGAKALKLEEVTRRMAALGGTIWERLQRARRAHAVIGNLRWQSPRFVGRNRELVKLHQYMGTGAVGGVTALSGLGGQGKTELAVAYAHSWADSYPVGLWNLSAEGKRELLPLIGELAWERSLGFIPSDAEKNDAALLGRGVLQHLKARADSLREHDRDHAAACLLLLDNVSEPALLAPDQLSMLPGGMSADWLRIIVTTRLDLREQKERLTILAVDALDEDSAVGLLRDHQPPRDTQQQIVSDYSHGEPQFASEVEESAAREIVRTLGCFTLAVEQVALYLGLHPEVSPSAFLATLTRRGLLLADHIVQSDPEISAQMLTQSKQLTLILDATLSKLDAPSNTALKFAALLPPDNVPWPWLRALTIAHHPELSENDEFGADRWHAIQRRLTGLRLLTPGDDPQITRIHRLVAAHLVGNKINPVHRSTLSEFTTTQAERIHQSYSAPEPWELETLTKALPVLLEDKKALPALGHAALHLTGKLLIYRSVAQAATFLDSMSGELERRAETNQADASWQFALGLWHGQSGTVLLTLGDLKTAGVHFCERFAISERLVSNDPANTEWQSGLAGSHLKLGDLAVALGDLPTAFRYYADGFAISECLVASDPGNTEWRRDLSVSYSKLGNLAVTQGDLPSAFQHFSECLKIAEALAASDPANSAWQRDLCLIHVKLGDLSFAQGDLAGASGRFAESVAIRRRLVAMEPSNSAWQRDLSVSMNKLGNLAIAQGDLPDAMRHFTDSLSIRENLVVNDPDNVRYQRDLSVSLEKLGDLAETMGDLPAAMRYFAECHTIRETLAIRTPANTEWQSDLSISLEKLGDLAMAEGDLSSALRYLTDSLTIRERLVANHPGNAKWQRNLYIAHLKLGDLAVARGDLSAALRGFTDSIATAEYLVSSDPGNAAWQRDLWVSYWKVANVFENNGNPDEASNWWLKAHEALTGMKARNLFVSAQDEEFLEELRLKLGR